MYRDHDLLFVIEYMHRNLNLAARKAEKESSGSDVGAKKVRICSRIRLIVLIRSASGRQSPAAKSKAVGTSSRAKASIAQGSTATKATAAKKNKGNEKDQKAKGPAQAKSYPSKLKPHVLVPPSPYRNYAQNASVVNKARTVPSKPAAPPKPIPKPVWTVLPTPLPHDEAIRRMNIREFLLRFAHLADIARTHLEELEELASANPYTDTLDTDDEEYDGPRLVGWISEPALRAILIGLMSLLAKDADERDDDTSPFTNAIQQIRASGANLGKMWSALATLRDDSDLRFPDPLPPPPSAVQRSTRTRESTSTTPVVTTAQLVEVVAALVESVLETRPVQDDFERAATQEKDLSRAARELTAAENLRYKELKAAEAAGKQKKDDKSEGTVEKGKGASKGPKVPLEVRKAALAEHEALLAEVDCAHRIALSECIPRFGPLGRDTEGRVYYAITPGVIEREAALELLEGGKGKVKFGKRRVAELEERTRTKYWSWFVAVWGRKPEGAEVAKLNQSEGDDDAEDEDEDAERWWTFWQPEEVAKLAEWLAMKHNINLDTKRPAKSSDDLTVVNVDGDGESDKKSRGRPSNASTRTFASMNNSDSDLSEPDDSSNDGDVQMRMDSRGEPVPTRSDLRTLARGLKEYAELLEWRIKRVAKDGKDSADEKAEKADKGKAVERNGGPIPPKQFYGK